MEITNISPSAFRKLFIALALYLTSLLASNTLGLKIMPFLFGSHLSVAVFMFPIVFLMTDVVGEVYGRRIARYFVLAGFISTALFTLYNVISVLAPWAPAGSWIQASYDGVFAVTPRIAVASLVAFIVGEYQDVLMFFFSKRVFGRFGFWFRSLLSNVWSQFLDAVLFMGIAFYGAGVYPTSVLVSITITWWLYKVAMGFLYTPLAYAGIWLLKDKPQVES